MIPRPVDEPSPALLFDTLNGSYRIAAIRSAIELDLFTTLADQSLTAAELAQGVRAAPRGVRIVSDVLAMMGFLEKVGDRYRQTADSATFLDRRSALYLGGIINLFANAAAQPHLADPTAAVRAGGTILGEQGTMAPDHEMWVPFARLMAPMMVIPAEHIAEAVRAAGAGPWKVLDIAAGHGVFGITIAERNPEAEIVAVDWPRVLEVAQENATAAGINSRYRVIPGSAFDVDFGDGYDLVLMTNFLHHFDLPTNEKLLRKVRAALKPTGRLATLEFVVNEDRLTPPTSALFAMIMLLTTRAGDAYSFAELEEMCKNAGFSRSQLIPLGRQEQRLVLSFP